MKNELTGREKLTADLLEALVAMVEMYEEVQPAGGWQGVYDCAQSAIQKATDFSEDTKIKENEKLIDAAPDLLDACITLEDIVSEIEARLDDGQPIDTNLSWEELRDAWVKAQNAIQKATE